MISTGCKRRIGLAGLLVGVGLGGCATPVAPTGGPTDTTPPFVIETVPAPNTVDFSSDRITIEFSENVDRASLQRALAFTPNIAIPPEFDWDGRRVEIIFPDQLRDSTTYILQIDNQFRDNRGVALDSPITLAFSTGPTIDAGMIRGRIADPENNQPLEGIDVLAFELDEGWTLERATKEPAAYRTQSASDGSFAFEHLADRTFFVVGLEDRNRNRVIDSLEAVALPAWGPQQGDLISDAPPGTGESSRSLSASWFIDRSDEVPPEMLQLQSINARLTEVRFSEPVVLRGLESAEWALADTATSRVFESVAVYQPPAERNRVVVVTDSLPFGTYRLFRAGEVADSAGNAVRPSELLDAGVFAASTRPDTISARFVGFGPSAATGSGPTDIATGRSPWVRFSRHIDASGRDQIVAASDQKGVSRSISFSSSDGTRWLLDLEPPGAPGDSITVSVSGRPAVDTTYTMVYAFLGDAQTGSVTGAVRGGERVRVELTPEDHHARLEAVADQDGRFRFLRLLKGSYRLRAFSDVDGNGRWSAGSVRPPRLPEHLIWYHEPIDVRKGWESVVDTLEFRRFDQD